MDLVVDLEVIAGTVAQTNRTTAHRSSLRPDVAKMADTANSYRTQFPDPDWHEIAERAAGETDPKKLALLVKALCDRLDELKRLKIADPQ